MLITTESEHNNNIVIKINFYFHLEREQERKENGIIMQTDFIFNIKR